MTPSKTISEPVKIDRVARWQWIFVALFAALVRIPDFFYPISRDSGLFSYGGWRILQGALPYRDFWDNKLPGIFYIDALAIRLFGASTAALVIFQMIYMAVTACLFLAVARRFCRQSIAIIVTFLFAFYHSSHGISDGGNYTETYIALPMLAAILLVLNWIRDRRGYLIPFLSGVLIAIAALIKQPAASLVGATVIYLIFSNREKREYRAALAVIAGTVTVALLTVAWMAYTGILQDAKEANIVFNRLYFLDSYSGKGLIGAKWSLIRGINLIALPLAGAVGGMVVLRLRRHSIRGIFWLLMPWLFLDMLGLCMGGRFTNHYFLALLPSTFILTGILIDYTARSWKTSVIVAVTGLVFFIGPAWDYDYTPTELAARLPICSVAQRQYKALHWIVTRRTELGVKLPAEELADWLRVNTKETDFIYVWGWETRAAFLAKRPICSRYVHTHPLGATGFGGDVRIKELAEDIGKNRPKYIIDASVLGPTTAPPLDGSPHAPEWSPFFCLDGYEPVFEVIARYYTRVDTIAGCPVYERKL